MTSPKTLYYIYDPMCSWCWGYKPVWHEIESELGAEIEIVYVLGGLAPDSDVPMPEAMQQQIASYWKKIETFLGTQFNYDFWSKNTPRRSTYPACRAALAARRQKAEKAMLSAIQQAYYLDAKNPSDDEVLIGLAQDLGLDMATFKADFLSEQTHQALLEEIEFSRAMGAQGFPSLVLKSADSFGGIPVNYQDAQATIGIIRSLV